jgi:hypothetical protein
VKRLVLLSTALLLASAAAGEDGGAALSLAGLKLVSARDTSGHRETVYFDFCSDGTFIRQAEALQSLQAGRATSERTDQGMWRIAGSTLELRYAHGRTERHAVKRMAADAVTLDGTRYAAERSSRCR